MHRPYGHRTSTVPKKQVPILCCVCLTVLLSQHHDVNKQTVPCRWTEAEKEEPVSSSQSMCSSSFRPQAALLAPLRRCWGAGAASNTGRHLPSAKILYMMPLFPLHFEDIYKTPFKPWSLSIWLRCDLCFEKKNGYKNCFYNLSESNGRFLMTSPNNEHSWKLYHKTLLKKYLSMSFLVKCS